MKGEGIRQQHRREESGGSTEKGPVRALPPGYERFWADVLAGSKRRKKS